MDSGVLISVHLPPGCVSARSARLGAAGSAVIHFNEFGPLPALPDYEMGIAGIQPMRYYYVFEPTRPRLLCARKVAGRKRLSFANVDGTPRGVD